jgi:hypothetical protein
VAVLGITFSDIVQVLLACSYMAESASFPSFLVYSVFPNVNWVVIIKPPAMSAIGNATLRKSFDM